MHQHTGSGWIPVQRDVKVFYDLETTPLYINTDSEGGSNEKVEIHLYRDSEPAGFVYIYFQSPPKYYLAFCTNINSFPTTVPAATDKVWKITMIRNSSIRFIIHCNDVEVLNVLINHSTCSHDSRWVTYWTRDVDKINFSSTDTASDFWGGCNPKKTEKNRKKPKKTSPKFEISGSVRFFSVFFGIFRLFSVFFGFFRYFSVFFGFLWYFFGFFRSELRQEIPVIQKSCQQ